MMPSVIVVWRRLLLALVRPGSLGRELTEARSKSEGAVAVAQLGVLWAVFCAVLHAAGHGPSFSLLPIATESYYLAQAIFVVPLTLGLWWLMSAVGAAVAGAKRSGRDTAVFVSLGYAYAAPLIFAFLLVDILLYAVLGFEAMGRYIRFYAPIAPLWAVVVGSIAVRETTGVSRGRAFAATLAGMLAQALIGGVFLR